MPDLWYRGSKRGISVIEITEETSPSPIGCRPDDCVSCGKSGPNRIAKILKDIDVCPVVDKANNERPSQATQSGR